MNQITKDDTQSMTQDIVKTNIEQLKSLFPEVFSEDRIDFEALQSLLGEYVDKEDERYSFNWKGKANARRIAQTPSTATLRPAKEESKNWDKTENLYIEGDNLEVLKLLQKSYHNKIKMIYIDPPYNTGNDFVYSDDFKDSVKNYLEITGQVDENGKKVSTNSDTHGRYHSNWLNMMYPRLKLARNLLKDDGVIFISIDDNEIHNLRKICDEVFGEGNLLDTVVWKKTENIKMDSRFLSQNKDYVLCYRKSATLTEFQKEQSDINRFTLEDDKGKYYLRKLDSKSSAYRPTLDYVIENEGIKYYPGGTEEQWQKRQAGNVGQFAPRWLWSREKFEQGLKDGDVIFKDGKIYNKVRYDGIAKKPFTDMPQLPSGQTAQKELNELLDKRLFDYPKSPRLVEWLEKLVFDNSDFIVLDFFSGSATTAHAVMQLNAEDGGNRKYIMVQLPEPTDENSEAFKAGFKNICEIGKERIRRAGDKIVKELKEKQSAQKLLTNEVQVNPDDLDVGFKVFKLDTSNIKTWDSSTENIQQALLDSVSNIKSERSQEDVLYEVLLKYGLDLTLPIEEFEQNGKKLYSVGFGSLVICLENNIDISIAEKIVEIKDAKKPETMNVIFKDNGFKDDVVKANTIQLLTKHGVESVRSI